MENEIKEIIQQALPNATIYVMDPNQDGQHFEALVISPDFEGMPLVKQHKLVMQSLELAFKTSVHALALKTFTPQKWETQKHNYIAED